MSRLQEEFNRQTGDFYLTPGEYEGPLVIDRPCTVDGGHSTLWAPRGPVLTVAARGVTVRNLRVEVTENTGSRTAIETRPGDTVLEGVEVSGDVAGLPGEEGWDLPSMIALGDFAAGEVNAFSYDLTLPSDAELACGVQDLHAGPSRLRRGVNRLTLETGTVRDNTILYGELLIRTNVTRRIYVTGKAVSGAPVHLDAEPVSGTLPLSEPLKMEAPPVIPPAAGPQDEKQVRQVVRGQRMPLAEPGGVLRIAYDCAGVQRPVELDGYVFLLRGDGKVSGDNDLIFFSNPESETGCVKVTASDEKPLVLLALDKAPDRTQKIAVCFSIYGDDPAENFSLVRKPCLRLFGREGEFCRFAMDDLGVEKTVVALEVYRYKGEWRVNFVGAGYQSGLETLCRRYGVDVS